MSQNPLLIVFRKLSLLFAGTGIGNNRFLYGLYKKMLSLLKPKMVITEGSKMYLDREDTLLLSVYPNFEPGETALVKKYVKPGMTVIDAGANIGYFTLLLSRLVGPKGHVYAFEPGKENYALLKKNIAVNGYTNITAVEAALADISGKQTLFLSSENPQDHRIVETADTTRESVTVQSVTIDKYFSDKKNPDFMKMDIQGAEILALSGAKKNLKKLKHFSMILEYWPYTIISSGKDPHIYFELLHELKFFYKLMDMKTGELKDCDEKQLLQNTGEKDIFTIFAQK